MTVRANKPAFNVREKLKELDYSHLPYEKMPPGSIIQSASTTITDSLILNAGTDSSLLGAYSDTPMTFTIKPKFPNSKLLVNFEFGLLLRDGTSGAAIGYGVKRNGTRVITSNTNPHEQFTGDHLVGFRTHYTYVDTTYNSTDPQTYLLEAYLRGGYTSMIAEFNSRSETANVVIYEVKQ